MNERKAVSALGVRDMKPVVFESFVPAAVFVDLYFHFVLSIRLSLVDTFVRWNAKTRTERCEICDASVDFGYQFIVHEIFDLSHQILSTGTKW